jgi:hypothetical protein
MRRVGQVALVALLALAVTRCATMSIGSYVERGTDFTRYATWDWGAADALPTGDPRLDNNGVFQDYLQGAIEKQLRARRFERTTTGEPDLLVHVHASVMQRIDVDRVDRERGYCDAGNCGPRVIEYEAGTLVLDVVDARTNRLLWRGWAQDSLQGIIEDQDVMEAQINRAVRGMFERFPVI